MENLFSVIVLIAAGVFLFIFYYAGRNKFRRYKDDRIRFKIEKKIYEDEKNYLRYYFRSLLNKLKNGDLGWVQVASRIYPQDKVEIVFNHLTGQIQMQNRHFKLSTHMLKELKGMGLTDYSYRNEINLLSMPVNAKIVTDALYFCLEEIYGHKNVKNIKVNKSGGTG